MCSPEAAFDLASGLALKPIGSHHYQNEEPGVFAMPDQSWYHRIQQQPQQVPRFYDKAVAVYICPPGDKKKRKEIGSDQEGKSNDTTKENA